MNNKKKLVLFDIDYTLFNTASFKDSNLSQYELYKEVIDVLTQIGKTAELGIFSQGENDFQREKLKRTGILEHFKEEKIHIFEKKEDSLVKILEEYKDFQIFLVDDKINILAEAKKHEPSVYTVWIKRGPFAEDTKLSSFNPDAVLEELGGLESIVKNNGTD